MENSQNNSVKILNKYSTMERKKENRKPNRIEEIEIQSVLVMTCFALGVARGGGRVTHDRYFVLRRCQNDSVLLVVRSLQLCLGPNGLLLSENEEPLDLLRSGRHAPTPKKKNKRGTKI